MLNLLWLLLPVAAAGGWFAAQRNMAGRSAAFWDHSRDFHAGLGALLDERRDRPDELFSELGGTDRDTADTHLALGRLFRRRGEVERAILLHESLLAKPELGEAVHADARYELGHDYGAAGFLERSEEAFRAMLRSGYRRDDAYESLIGMHERERDWTRAIAVAREAAETERGGKEPSRGEPAVEGRPPSGGARCALVAHYHCELAAEARASGYVEEAREQLDQALAAQPDFARAHLALGDLALAGGDYAEAIERYAKVEESRPELAPEIVERRVRALRSSDEPAALRDWLETVRERKNAYSVIRAARAVIEELDGAEAAERFFKRQVLARPSLRGLRDWARDQLAISRPGEREKVQVICAMLDAVVEDRPNYLCGVCGFRGNVLHWRCPGCGSWDSVGLIIGAEGE